MSKNNFLVARLWKLPFYLPSDRFLLEKARRQSGSKSIYLVINA